MTQETDATSGLTELGYDAAGNVVRVTDPMNSTTEYAYDGLSRLVSVTQPLGQTVRYGWDARDRLSKKIPSVATSKPASRGRVKTGQSRVRDRVCLLRIT